MAHASNLVANLALPQVNPRILGLAWKVFTDAVTDADRADYQALSDSEKATVLRYNAMMRRHRFTAMPTVAQVLQIEDEVQERVNAIRQQRAERHVLLPPMIVGPKLDVSHNPA